MCETPWPSGLGHAWRRPSFKEAKEAASEPAVFSIPGDRALDALEPRDLRLPSELVPRGLGRADPVLEEHVRLFAREHDRPVRHLAEDLDAPRDRHQERDRQAR